MVLKEEVKECWTSNGINISSEEPKKNKEISNTSFQEGNITPMI